nr:glycosyltransferase WbuB [Ramlibacter monticola]
MYSLNFAPELTGIGKYTGEMAKWLAERGHDVRVVTGHPYYPEWRVHSGYKANEFRREMWNNVTVIRCPLWVPARANGIRRLLHLGSFACTSFLAMLGQLKWRPQIVWVVEPALFCAPTALLVSRLSSARSWLHIQDYEVDAAFAMGLLKGRGLKSIALRVESWLMQRFHIVSTISGRMLELAAKKGVHRDQLVPLPNWVDISAIRPIRTTSVYRKTMGAGERTVVVLYSGNMGTKQGLEVVARVARDLSQDGEILFVLCGDGAGKDELVQQCAGLKNVKFLALQPQEALNDLLGAADIHLLPQRADAADLVLPSKLTGMLASGRPVIATALAETELGTVITHARCGLLVPPDDPAALAKAIRQLAGDGGRRMEMGLAARAYAEQHLDINEILDRFSSDASGQDQTREKLNLQ